jgi:hypothetical protein
MLLSSQTLGCLPSVAAAVAAAAAADAADRAAAIVVALGRGAADAAAAAADGPAHMRQHKPCCLSMTKPATTPMCGAAY